METKLNMSDLLKNFQHMIDTIWIISLDDDRVEIHADSMTPQLANRQLTYSQVSDMYTQQYVYPLDIPVWEKQLSLSSLRKMAEDKCFQQTFDIRFLHESFGFEWHEGAVNILTDDQGKPRQALLTSRNVNDIRKAHIIEQAVQTEYDYVIYIEANQNSYILYTSSQHSHTPIPPIASNNYEKEVSDFHKKYVPQEEQQTLTRQLSIAHVSPILRQYGEYTVCCKVIENGEPHDKKLRFSYLDRKRNIWLLTRTDITEIGEEKRQKKLLQDALQTATIANRAKSDFLSRMSHDIRTPMNAIIGMTAIAALHLDDQKRMVDCLNKINISSKLLLNLINEVLDMSKLESGRIMLMEEEFNFGDLLQNLVVMIQTSIDEKNQHFAIHVHSLKHENLIGDIQRIQQALLNLLSNAIKYTPPQGNITLDITEKQTSAKGYGTFEITVTDNGIGMKPDFLKKIFEPFERADDTAIRNIQGTGLGMAISQNIAHMMNGEIRVQSEYGKGSQFTLTMQLKFQVEKELHEDILVDLPVLVVDDDQIACEIACSNLNEIGMKSEWVLSGAEAVERVKVKSDFFAVIIDLMMPDMNGIQTTLLIRECVGPDVPIIIISAYDYSLYEEEALKAGVNGFISKPLMTSRLFQLMKRFALKETTQENVLSNALPSQDLSGKRILVVEDNELNREIAQELLQETGAKIETANDGRIAVEMVQKSIEGYYDLILMDIQMPVMDGFESTKAIRALQRADSRTLPIVAMSANAFAEDMARSKAAGMNHHIAKPIDLKNLFEVIGRLLTQTNEIAPS